MRGDLPDVNLLLALAWPNHQFHAPARRWFAQRNGHWHTCALTQLGFVRLSSNPAFTKHAKTPLEATLLLSAMTRHPQHRFVEELNPLDDDVFSKIASRLMGHQQVTDAYLVSVAYRHGLQLVTFDRKIDAASPFRAVVRLLEG